MAFLVQEVLEVLDEERGQQQDIARTPMRRAGSAEEAAPPIPFLAGDESSFVTGTELVVDGSLTAH
ncbi:SDR family oxidoreductase [Streptomyces iconiensis]|uniref:SDR family oxidoreductase n=1 Tax=Streptomyces iconiensis TaxID=1384038 RepID=A0ABT6ZN56_9ACTN|nr:SDR family oxidoreductase [Streptomyces iconiensis]MDJ1130488.1 SDR family oxidoreductase [Streptomyces iconiensis]